MGWDGDLGKDELQGWGIPGWWEWGGHQAAGWGALLRSGARGRTASWEGLGLLSRVGVGGC